jgi:hypothetical protein
MAQSPTADHNGYLIQALRGVVTDGGVYGNAAAADIAALVEAHARLEPVLTLPFVNPALYRGVPGLYEIGNPVWTRKDFRKRAAAKAGKISALLGAAGKAPVSMR